MIPITLVPPVSYSEDVAYRALAPIRPFINAALTQLVSGLTAKTARALFNQLEVLFDNMQEAYASGSLDGSVEWKGKVGAALQDIGAIAAVAAPIQIKYAKLTGSTIATAAENGQTISLDEANDLIEFDQADIDAVVAVINSVLEV